MTSRSPLIALLILLALPAAGHASDPLLSGYAGPGGGEQVVLGGGTVGGGGGHLRRQRRGATATARREPARGRRARAAPARQRTSSKLTEKPQKRKSPSSLRLNQKTMPSATARPRDHHHDDRRRGAAGRRLPDPRG